MTRAPLKSMTGFAQGRVERNGWALRINLRSVNHRFLDLHLRLPEGFEVFEPSIRAAVRERLRRGHVDVTLYFEPAGPASVQVNREVAGAYLQAMQELREQFRVAAEPDLAAVLRLPGVIASTAIKTEEEQERIGAAVIESLTQALERLEEMRRAEGRTLAEEMARRLQSITRHAEQIAARADKVRPAYARRMEARLKELLAESNVDPARLVQEAAIVAERGDISEEVARLKSHVQQFQALLGAAEETGKKLDFLLQEMQREANTMLSKTPGVEEEGLSITALALEVKSEIEKLREQVQNVE